MMFVVLHIPPNGRSNQAQANEYKKEKKNNTHRYMENEKLYFITIQLHTFINI